VDNAGPATSLAAVPSPQAVAVVGSTVFVTEYDAHPESNNSFVVARISGGGAVETVEPDGADIITLVSDETHAYYGVRWPDVHVARVDQGGGPSTLFELPPSTTPVSMATDGQRVYVTLGNTVGGARSPVPADL
jgi:hypothetical protein